MTKKPILLIVFILILSIAVGTMSFAESGKYQLSQKDEKKTITIPKGTTVTGQNGGSIPNNNGKPITKPTDLSRTIDPNNLLGHQMGNPGKDTRTADHSSTEIYGYFWYVLDLNNNSTEKNPQLLRKRDKFSHTFKELGDYQIERYTVKLRYDWTTEKEYRSKESPVTYFEDDENGNPIKKIKYNIEWILVSSKNIRNSKSIASPVTEALKATNGTVLGTVKATKPKHLDDGNIYQSISHEKTTWRIHVTDVPLPWHEGDGSTKVGGSDAPEVDVELIK